jgi:hypothetical protein
LAVYNSSHQSRRSIPIHPLGNKSHIMPEAISHHNIVENVVGESRHVNRASPAVCHD